MNKFVTALAALGLLAAPIAANAQELSIEGTVGTDFEGDVSYGLGAGLDFDLSDSIIVGVETSVEDFMDDNDPALFYGGARLGAYATDSTLLYVNGGVAFINDETGYRLGGGVEQDLTKNVYAKLAYDYTDFGNDVDGHGGTIGIGLRF